MNFSGIDWAATGAMLQGGGTLIGAGAVIWAAQKGAATFEDWRLQKIAERRSTQAERILTATYKARRALNAVRSPFMWAHETEAAAKKIEESKGGWGDQPEAQKKRISIAKAYFNRLDSTKPEQDELIECLPIALVIFGEELEQAIEALSRQFWVVRVDADSSIDDDGKDPNFSKKIRRGLYDLPARDGEVNEVTEAVNAAVKIIEKFCLPALRLEFKTSS